MSKIKDRILGLLSSVEREGIEDLVDYLCSSDYFTAPASTRHHLAREGGLAEHSLNVFDMYYHLCKFYIEDNDVNAVDKVSKGSIIIESLLHDFCKIGMYKVNQEEPSSKQIGYLKSLLNRSPGGIKIEILGENILISGEIEAKCYLSKSLASDMIGWLKGDEEEMPKMIPGYSTVDSKFILGHGARSVIRIMDFISLTPAEEAAIYYHMGLWEHSGPGGVMCDRYFINSMNLANSEFPDVSLLQMADRMASFKENWE